MTSRVGQLRNEPLAGRDEGPLGKVPVHLGRPGAPVLARHPPEPRVAQGLGEVADLEGRPAVALARQGQHRVGPEPYRVVADPPGEVHAEERELGVRDRVDEVPGQVAPLGPKLPVIAAEGHDARLLRGARQPRHPVGLQAGAGEHPGSGELTPAGPDRDRPGRRGQANDQVPGEDHATQPGDIACHGLGDPGEIDDSRGR